MITVVEQDTNQRMQEIHDNFMKIKPLLDNGYNYSNAVVEVGLCNPNSKPSVFRWFKDLVAYGETMGYLYKDYTGRRLRK